MSKEEGQSTVGSRQSKEKSLIIPVRAGPLIFLSFVRERETERKRSKKVGDLFLRSTYKGAWASTAAFYLVSFRIPRFAAAAADSSAKNPIVPAFPFPSFFVFFRCFFVRENT